MAPKQPFTIVLPGAFWVALIGFVTLWLPQFVPDAPWLPDVLLLLAALGKGLQVYLKGAEQPASRTLDTQPAQPVGKLSRWFWG